MTLLHSSKRKKKDAVAKADLIQIELNHVTKSYPSQLNNVAQVN